MAVPPGDPQGPASAINTGIYYRLFNQNSGKVAAVSGASTSPGAQLTQYSDNGTLDHNWSFIPVGSTSGSIVPGAYYSLTNVISGLNLDDPSGSNAGRMKVQLWGANNATAQNWRFNQQRDGAFTLTNEAGGLNLDNPSGSRSVGPMTLSHR